MACARAPRGVKAEYLLCCWLDSYALRFVQGMKVQGYPPLLQRAFLPTTFPSSGALSNMRRVATCDILSFVARFGVCTPEVLTAVQRLVIRTPYCGNICQLHGIFVTMHDGTQTLVPTRLACHTVPERLFRHAVVLKMPDYVRRSPVSEHRVLTQLVRHVCELVPVSIHENETRLPPLSHLEMIVRMILLHHASPNSAQGYPLAMAVHLGSMPLVCLLLATGADPALKKGIAMHVACKKRSLDLIQLLVEQDDTLELQWETRLRAIVDDLVVLDALRATRRILQRPKRVLPTRGAAPAKRRRLADRCTVDLHLLNTAAHARAWDVVSYLMNAKGVVPDVSTLQKLDQIGMP